MLATEQINEWLRRHGFTQHEIERDATSMCDEIIRTLRSCGAMSGSEIYRDIATRVRVKVCDVGACDQAAFDVAFHRLRLSDRIKKSDLGWYAVPKPKPQKKQEFATVANSQRSLF